MAVLGQALLQHRHVLDFSNALCAASLMAACDGDFETALRKIAPSDEAAKKLADLRRSARTISNAMQGEQQALEKSGSAMVLLLSVTAVIRGLDEKAGHFVRDIQHYYLPCNDPAKNVGSRGIAVTLAWDLPGGVTPTDKLQATVWVQFLAFPAEPKRKENEAQAWNVESRKLRFALKGGSWIKE